MTPSHAMIFTMLPDSKTSTCIGLWLWWTCFDALWKCNKESYQYDDEAVSIHFQHPKQTTQFKADYNRLVLLPRDAMLAWYMLPSCVRLSSVCPFVNKWLVVKEFLMWGHMWLAGKTVCDPSNTCHSWAHLRWLRRCAIQIDVYFTYFTQWSSYKVSKQVSLIESS